MKILALVTIFLLSNAFGQKSHTVSGEVLNSANHPLKDVRIDLVRSSETKHTTSQPDGTYSIGFEEDGPIDNIQYELIEWEPAVVSGLSSARDHKIYKTLYPKGTKHDDSQAQEVISALETIYLSRVRRGAKQAELKDHFAAIIDSLNVPEDLNDRVRAIRALYGMPLKR